MISKRLTDAFGYVRMSSDAQEHSPAQQREEITKMTGDRGIRIAEWFVDEGITGDSVAQTAVVFGKSLVRLKQGAVKNVVCWDLSRFGRFDPFEAGEVIAPFAGPASNSSRLPREISTGTNLGAKSSRSSKWRVIISFSET